MLECNRSMRKKFMLMTRVFAVLLPVILLTVLLSQTVMALNTYVISDGDRVTIHTTYATDPAEVLSEAGFELNPDDFYTTQISSGKSEITIQRLQTVTIYLGQTQVKMQTYGETVASILNRAGITLTDDDAVSVQPNTNTRDGMTITVSRTQYVVETYDIEVPYETLYCYAPNLPEGQQVVLTKGVNGIAERTANVMYINGTEISRTPLSDKVTLEPVKEVIAIGSKAGADIQEMPETSLGMPIIGDGVIITPQGEVLNYSNAGVFTATAYHNTDPGCTIYTYIGTLCRVGAIAVDPKVIPLGTKMYIVSNDGRYIYGEAVAEDTGGSIKGNRIDLYFDSVPECIQFGIRDCTVYFLN
ncbi:MAG: G5 domain-containing protein [Oscillospiraceae bacterium]|nr:G5 domain-containing protein [Oscillospiraceae bacterium]